MRRIHGKAAAAEEEGGGEGEEEEEERRDLVKLLKMQPLDESAALLVRPEPGVGWVAGVATGGIWVGYVTKKLDGQGAVHLAMGETRS